MRHGASLNVAVDASDFDQDFISLRNLKRK
jgi:hypothetical protein